jgi:DNA-binding PadR family transcriptional regulator
MRGKPHHHHHRMTANRRFGPGPGGPGDPDAEGLGASGPGLGEAGFGFGSGYGPRHGGGPGYGPRHGGGPGYGPRHGFGPPLGGGPGRGRRRRRGDVRFALLRALQDEPQNGYQLMQAIEERSGGRWRPSPGSVYPALAQLEDQGFVRSVERDGQKLYELTDPGREHLSERPDRPSPWEQDDDPASQVADELRSLVGQVAQATIQVSQVADAQQMQSAKDLLTEARRSLYRILAEDSGPAAAEDSDPTTTEESDPTS